MNAVEITFYSMEGAKAMEYMVNASKSCDIPIKIFADNGFVKVNFDNLSNRECLLLIHDMVTKLVRDHGAFHIGEKLPISKITSFLETDRSCAELANLFVKLAHNSPEIFVSADNFCIDVYRNTTVKLLTPSWTSMTSKVIVYFGIEDTTRL